MQHAEQQRRDWKVNVQILSDRQITILKTIQKKASGRDAKLLDDAAVGNLERNDIQRVCELINDEYLMFGIEEDYSPNEIGLELQSLLNRLNAVRLT